MISPVQDARLPEIHAGKDETSVMLALAPDLVRRERIAELKAPPDGAAVRALILDPAVSWPWSSGDKRIAETGRHWRCARASAEHGSAIVRAWSTLRGACSASFSTTSRHAECRNFEPLRDSPNEVLITAGYQDRWIMCEWCAMAGHGDPAADKLRAYLRELKPGAQALLIAELERGLLQGTAPAGAELVLSELRRSLRDGQPRSARFGDPGSLVLPADRAVPGRRRSRPQASRPDRALGARAAVALDRQCADARRGEALFRAGRAGADRRRHRQRRASARMFQDHAVRRITQMLEQRRRQGAPPPDRSARHLARAR